MPYLVSCFIYIYYLYGYDYERISELPKSFIFHTTTNFKCQSPTGRSFGDSVHIMVNNSYNAKNIQQHCSSLSITITNHILK